MLLCGAAYFWLNDRRSDIKLLFIHQRPSVFIWSAVAETNWCRSSAGDTAYEPNFRGENVASALWRWDCSDRNGIPWTNLDCGGRAQRRHRFSGCAFTNFLRYLRYLLLENVLAFSI
jgi:hypothetical protein